MKVINISEEFITKISKEANNHVFESIESAYVHKANQENVLISDIEEIPIDYICEENRDRSDYKYLYIVALPKYDCSFCFDHELDHIPFIMTIEFIRQIGVAIGHKVHGFPIEGFCNIMDMLNFKIGKFLELDIPTVIIL